MSDGTIQEIGIVCIQLALVGDLQSVCKIGFGELNRDAFSMGTSINYGMDNCTITIRFVKGQNKKLSGSRIFLRSASATGWTKPLRGETK